MRLGIDLGTSNSSVAFYDPIDGVLRNVKVSSGDEPYDSILRSCALMMGDRTVIGSAAEREYRAKPGYDFIPTFKPYLNETQLRRVVVVRQESRIVGYSHLWQEPIWSSIAVEDYVGGPFSEKEVVNSVTFFVSALLEKSQEEIQRRGETFEGYLLGIPLNAKLIYRFRLLDAVRAASPFEETYSSVIRRTSFIPEPIAVSFCFRERIASYEDKVLVFDYGGGTLDCAVLGYEKVDGFVLPTKLLGLSCLEKAGNHVNELLKEHLFEKYPGYERRFNELDPVMKYFEENQIETIKIRLSKEDEVNERLFSGQEIRITRNTFKQVLSALLDEVENCINRCCCDGGIADYGEIKKVIMSGGSCLIPAIQDQLRGFFGPERVVAPNPKRLGDIEEALTGVSRGLASFDFFIRMSGLQANIYQVWNQSTGSFVTVLGRNEKSGKISNNLSLDGYSGGTLCIFHNMIKEEPLIALTDLPVPVGGKCEVRISQKDPLNILPRVEIMSAEGKLILSKDLTRIGEREAEEMIRDRDWAISSGNEPSWIIPAIPIEVGNYIKVKGIVYEVVGEESRREKCRCWEKCKKEGRPISCIGRACDKGEVTIG